METRTYELAGIGTRFMALFIDGLILGFVGGIFGVSVDFWGGGILGTLIGVAYQWYFLTQRDGQTLGKMVLGIRVVKVDGSPISDADAVLRYIGYIINSPVLMLGWLWALWDENSQGWHDKIARTYVVKADSAPRRKNDTVQI